MVPQHLTCCLSCCPSLLHFKSRFKQAPSVEGSTTLHFLLFDFPLFFGIAVLSLVREVTVD